MKPRLDPHLFVVFGATGDLMARKLLPAIYRLDRAGRFGRNWQLLGVARADSPMDDAGYRAWAGEVLVGAEVAEARAAKAWCDAHLSFEPIGAGEAYDYQRLASRIAAIDATHGLKGNRAIYLALPPGAFPDTIRGLGEAGLNHSAGYTRLVVEKPFGSDLASAEALNQLVHSYFKETQVYRIDHYLGKETVQNLLVFRFSNPIFESLWSRDHVECIQITVAEELGVEHRAGYYDRAGALRDMLQSHLTQLLTVIAMEVPATFAADDVRNEKVKVLRSIHGLDPKDVVFGQYAAGQVAGTSVAGYLDEPGVPAGSTTETFVALQVDIDNWRWQGVPFFLRTGKRLPRRTTQIVVVFRRAPVWLFGTGAASDIHRNMLTITLQPDEGFELCFDVKAPGDALLLKQQALYFGYEQAFGPPPEAYQTLLLEVLTGDQTLFVRADEVEASWQLYGPLLVDRPAVVHYAAGSWGPRAAETLVTRRHDRWRTT